MNNLSEEYLPQIRNGDEQARSALIGQYRSFILKVVKHVCKRRIGWSDDEASIGLIAFNEAVDRYRTEYGKTFNNFAFLMIRRRLIDDFRKKIKISQNEADWKDEEEMLYIADKVRSLDAFERQERAAALSEELDSYDERLQEFGVCLRELEDIMPSHRDTRQMLVRIARHFCNNRDWLNNLFQKKKLPLMAMTKEINISKKTLERNRKYLISLILIFGCEDFARIRESISFTSVKEETRCVEQL
ncbi:RNA polymerase sigma-I factor [Paenibacillus peoriae]|uniref:RNA polymerase sigma-I factor n=2 Tax=Paenibacillus TaxID=44249 RepID=UPI00026C5DE3|nr:RNA polymerase sigma-I factor [Paenibacillus peoriae]MEC0183447.1 RNA polymerase sigma-I factor [Paenibacillus peoriae]